LAGRATTLFVGLDITANNCKIGYMKKIVNTTNVSTPPPFRAIDGYARLKGGDILYPAILKAYRNGLRVVIIGGVIYEAKTVNDYSYSIVSTNYDIFLVAE
jgi:hypothetical protein